MTYPFLNGVTTAVLTVPVISGFEEWMGVFVLQQILSLPQDVQGTQANARWGDA